VSLTLAELDQWDPDAIHSVIQAATDRANGTRSTAAGIGDVIAATPWEGEARDAAEAATGRIRTDLLEHAEECDAVARAAASAESEVRDIKDDWRNVARMADRCGITINVETGELSYMPVEPRRNQEMERRVDIIEAEIGQLLARANTADAELAGAVRVAAGLESADALETQLANRPPVPMDDEIGNADGQDLLDGTLSQEGWERLNAATTLTDGQQAALLRGDLVLPPEQLAYLTAVSKSLDGKTTGDIVAIMDKLGPGGARLTETMALASNPHLAAGPPVAGKPGLPLRGDPAALPSGIKNIYNSPALREFWSPPGSGARRSRSRCGDQASGWPTWPPSLSGATPTC